MAGDSGGIGIALRQIVALAKRNSASGAGWVQQYVRERRLADMPTAEEKVAAIVSVLSADSNPSPADVEMLGQGRDADDVVAAAAAACMVLGIPCRIVGARYGQSWTCWLRYQDGDAWRTVDVVSGRHGESLLMPDEMIEVECEQEEAKMQDGRHEETLADGVRLVVHDQHRHHIERSVTLTMEDPVRGGGGAQLEATVSATVSTYEPHARTPTLQFAAQPWWTRKQWEAAKRLGDRAWDEYERRFPNG